MSHEDAAALLSEFIYQIDNLPSEVAFILEEIGHKDEKVQEARLRNLQRDAVIQKHIKQNGLLVSNPKEAPLLPKMRADQAKIAKLSEEKVALAERAVRLLEKYVVKLDGEFQRLKDMGYNLGEAEAAAQAAAQAQVAAASAAMPALDLSMNKKRLANVPPGLATGNKIPNMNAQFMAQGLPSAGLPSANGMPGFPTNPYAANSNPFQGTNLQNQTFQTMQAGMNNPLYPNMGQFNPTGLTPSQQQAMAQFQQQNQGQFAQMQLQAAQAAGMILPNMQGGQNARDPSRPHRPSRLSSSFSATGAGPHAQILPSTAAAHMPPSQGSAGQSQQASGSTKRVRPSQAGAGRKNKKKRIVETDDESGADDGSAQAEASEDVDAEGEEEDAEGEDDRSMLSAVPANKRNANQKGVSRAGTPAGAAGTKAQQKAAAARKAGKKQDDEEEDAEADAEGEEDWGAEVDETNADDPTLYCFCNRVSYGNMIACDNPDCKYEWFHWACVRVTKQPDDDQKWYCPECRPKMLGQSGQGMGKGNVNFQGGRVLGAGAGPYQQLQAQQQQMMMAAQQAREGSTGGRSSRRG